MVIGDLHCGSLCGLTPPGWMVSRQRSRFYHDLQQEMWDNYMDILSHFGDVDDLVVNGDVIDGKGTRSGGTEMITSDMFEQTRIATEALSQIRCKNIYFTYGTAYHTASEGGEDFDQLVASNFNANIYDELDLNAGGVVFNIRHKIGASSNPSSRAMPVGKARLWDALRSIRNDDQPADVYIRSHVHYFCFCGESKWTAFTIPALQASNTKYGARQCIGITDWGMCLFKVDDGMLSGWDCQMRELSASKRHVVSAK